jgi:hypothetical protein
MLRSITNIDLEILRTKNLSQLPRGRSNEARSSSLSVLSAELRRAGRRRMSATLANVGGMPARPIGIFFREQTALRKLAARVEQKRG